MNSMTNSSSIEAGSIISTLPNSWKQPANQQTSSWGWVFVCRRQHGSLGAVTAGLHRASRSTRVLWGSLGLVKPGLRELANRAGSSLHWHLSPGTVLFLKLPHSLGPTHAWFILKTQVADWWMCSCSLFIQKKKVTNWWGSHWNSKARILIRECQFIWNPLGE